MQQPWLHSDVDTPIIIIHQEILHQNIQDMSRFAGNQNLDLRPHIKTHKIPELAQLQIQNGAIGITVAKLGEAEIMAQTGIDDILIAYPIWGEAKLQRLEKLKNIAKVKTLVDGWEQAIHLSQFSNRRQLTFDVLIEVDTGLKRCGIEPGQPVLNLYQRIQDLPGVHVTGILTHAGHAYGAVNTEEVQTIARQEGEQMVSTAHLLTQHGFVVPSVSVGATPTVRTSGTIAGVTEIRPGNYVFNDMTQVRLGASRLENCSLRVVTRVVSKPSPRRLIIDAGAKTLALDQGAHGTTGVKGYGFVIGHPELTITRLSEEHGIIEIEENNSSIQVGDLLEIIPNHSCPVINLTDMVYLVEGGKIISSWTVKARGQTS